ncbi:hypothetical protein E2C01_056185 [Portunus trituberculatus]|uniref:Uncharacterized protein n=1 Tax=Portunus trituberculatus TaxID=210409 RepID=A0A5B7GWP1_PORTR|nr:hypothetical protein [Portunus trituberculatus]
MPKRIPKASAVDQAVKDFNVPEGIRPLPEKSKRHVPIEENIWTRFSNSLRSLSQRKGEEEIRAASSPLNLRAASKFLQPTYILTLRCIILTTEAFRKGCGDSRHS